MPYTINMRTDKEQAIKLRLKGRSYLEIKQALGIPKSTLAGWLGNIILSPDKKKKIATRSYAKSMEGLLKRNRNQTLLAKKRMVDLRNQGASEIEKLTRRDLLILGSSLYWAEGYKRPNIRNGKEVTYHAVSMTNSDPLLAKAFTKFLIEFCNVPLEKIKASLRLFSHLNESESKNFWSKTIGIPLANFQKTYYGISKSSLGKRPYNRLPYGVIQIVVADTRMFHRIMGHIEGIKKLV